MTRLALRSFAVGAAAGLVLFAGICLGMALAERTGWPR
jgi:hypothetical protein